MMLETLRQSIPEPAKDARLNLEAVLRPGPLDAAQRWGSAVAAALTARSPQLAEALAEAATGEGVSVAALEDAHAAAALMAMTNVYYRFRHLVDRPEYEAERPGLRMNRMLRPSGKKVDYELFCLVASALNACESCVRAHERVLREAGLTPAQINDAIRIASSVASAAVSLELPPLPVS